MDVVESVVRCLYLMMILFKLDKPKRTEPPCWVSLHLSTIVRTNSRSANIPTSSSCFCPISVCHFFRGRREIETKTLISNSSNSFQMPLTGYSSLPTDIKRRRLLVGSVWHLQNHCYTFIHAWNLLSLLHPGGWEPPVYHLQALPAS